MLEVRSYAGTPEELSDFVIKQWHLTYGGKMAVPKWSADYFRWQLRMDEPGQRQHLIAAYHGSQLAGVVCYSPMQFSMAGQRFSASQASWLSVSPDFQGQGVAGKLIEGCRSQHRDLGLRFQLGYAYYGHQSSRAPRFWKREQSSTTVTIRNVGFWVRILDTPKATQWNLSSFQRWVSRLTAPFSGTPRIPEKAGLVIRKVERRDLPRCLVLAEKSTQRCGLRLVWDEASLGRQLGFNGYSHALVAEEQGEVRGCITFHLLPMYGQTDATFGVLDLVLVSELSLAGRRALLNSVLVAMKDLGAVAALKLRVGDYPASLFFELGWIPRPPDSHVLVTWAGKPEPLPSLGRIHVLWR